MKDLPKKDLTIKQKEDFIKKIQEIDEAGSELIYILVQSYYMEHDNGEPSDILPYDGVREETEKKGRENLTWVFTDFPVSLRHILYKFVNLHLQNMQEELIREQSTLFCN